MSDGTSIAVADALRIIAVVELGLVAGLACAALGVYFTANVHIRRADANQRGALGRYVVTMAASYALLAAFAIAEIQGFYGTHLTWRTPIGFLASNFGLYAIVNLLAFENARLDLRDKRVHLEGTPDGSD